jgi:DNA-binding CsgD family transcriptional regulator
VKERSNTPTHAEIRVLRALARHGTTSAAAQALYLSPATVEAHLAHLRNKAGLRHAVQLVAWAAERGWLDENGTPEI